MPTPCESWPLRLASTRLAATWRASSLLLPAASMIAAHRVRSACAWNTFVIRRSHHRADLPRHEFVLAVAVLFALARLARCGREHKAEDALAHFLDAGPAVDDLAAIDVHV